MVVFCVTMYCWNFENCCSTKSEWICQFLCPFHSVIKIKVSYRRAERNSSIWEFSELNFVAQSMWLLKDSLTNYFNQIWYIRVFKKAPKQTDLEVHNNLFLKEAHPSLTTHSPNPFYSNFPCTQKTTPQFIIGKFL